MRKKIIYAIFILALAGGSGYYIWHDYESFSGAKEGGYVEVSGSRGEPAGVETGTCSLDQETGLPADSGSCDGGETATEAPAESERPAESSVEALDLDRPIAIPGDMAPKAAKLVTEKINKLVSDLKANPDSMDSLLALGIYRKMIKDYEGAAEAWEYAGKIYPKNPTPFNNLGDLYAHFLKDKKKAEKNFLKAIENGPDELYIYRSTYEFYRFVMKDDAKAKEILREALKVKPDSKEFQYLLNNY
ncbi:MAG: hypothetical protein GXP44_01755 [bacterium]|nr:hypothetical protein [bacterium]